MTPGSRTRWRCRKTIHNWTRRPLIGRRGRSQRNTLGGNIRLSISDQGASVFRAEGIGAASGILVDKQAAIAED
jgi:hypothetical protein